MPAPARTSLAQHLEIVHRLSRTLLQLNIATRAYHVDADMPWLDLMVASITPERYAAHLIKVYGFEAPIESAFRYTPGLAGRIDLRARSRAGLLVQDLMRLDMTASHIAQLPQRFTTFNHPLEALGWMYVVERATLLHAGAYRHLSSHLPQAGNALSYLSAYDGMASLRWSELGEALEAVASSAADTRKLVLAASQSFCALNEWFYEGDALRSLA